MGKFSYGFKGMNSMAYNKREKDIVLNWTFNKAWKENFILLEIITWDGIKSWRECLYFIIDSLALYIKKKRRKKLEI